jgi:uncharacterized protein
MKIAIFGASGWIGGTVAREALGRGHAVSAIVRDPARLQLSGKGLSVVPGDVTDPASISSAVAGVDAVAAAIGGRREAHHEVVPTAARALLTGLAGAGVKRLVWVGGAGSLEVAPGVCLIDTPQFPAEWKAEALAQAEALKLFRASIGGVEWSFLSPPAMLEPGQRSGRYRTGSDQLLVDDKGVSRISVEDYAVALVDELERPAHPRQRFTVAY